MITCDAGHKYHGKCRINNKCPHVSGTPMKPILRSRQIGHEERSFVRDRSPLIRDVHHRDYHLQRQDDHVRCQSAWRVRRPSWCPSLKWGRSLLLLSCLLTTVSSESSSLKSRSATAAILISSVLWISVTFPTVLSLRTCLQDTPWNISCTNGRTIYTKFQGLSADKVWRFAKDFSWVDTTRLPGRPLWKWALMTAGRCIKPVSATANRCSLMESPIDTINSQFLVVPVYKFFSPELFRGNVNLWIGER